MRKNSQLPLLAPTLLPPDGSGPSLLRPVSKLSGPPSHPYGKHFLDSESEDDFLDWVNEGPLPPAAARGVADTSQMKQSNWDDVLHEADQVEADHGKNQRRRLVKTSDLPKQQQHTTDAQGSRMELGGDKNTGARGADEDDLYDDFGFGEIAQPEPEADAIDVDGSSSDPVGRSAARVAASDEDGEHDGAAAPAAPASTRAVEPASSSRAAPTQGDRSSATGGGAIFDGVLTGVEREMLPLKDELTLLECKLPLELIASHWPPFREQWRFRVAQAASVAQLGGLVAYLDSNALPPSALGRTWQAGRVRWQERISSAADCRALRRLFTLFSKAVDNVSSAALPSDSGAVDGCGGATSRSAAGRRMPSARGRADQSRDESRRSLRTRERRVSYNEWQGVGRDGEVQYDEEEDDDDEEDDGEARPAARRHVVGGAGKRSMRGGEDGSADDSESEEVAMRVRAASRRRQSQQLQSSPSPNPSSAGASKNRLPRPMRTKGASRAISYAESGSGSEEDAEEEAEGGSGPEDSRRRVSGSVAGSGSGSGGSGSRSRSRSGSGSGSGNDDSDDSDGDDPFSRPRRSTRAVVQPASKSQRRSSSRFAEQHSRPSYAERYVESGEDDDEEDESDGDGEENFSGEESGSDSEASGRAAPTRRRSVRQQQQQRGQWRRRHQRAVIEEEASDDEDEGSNPSGEELQSESQSDDDEEEGASSVDEAAGDESAGGDAVWPEGKLAALFEEKTVRNARVERLLGWTRRREGGGAATTAAHDGRGDASGSNDDEDEHGDDGEGMHGRGADHSHATGASYVERFLVRWRGLSPLRCTWVSESQLLQAGAARQLKTFRNHGLDGHLPPPLPPPPPASLPPLYRIHETDEEKRRDDANGAAGTLLHPELSEMLRIGRIVALKPRRRGESSVRRGTDGGAPRVRSSAIALVKWAGLDYSHISWEAWADVRVLRGARVAGEHCARLTLQPPRRAPSGLALATALSMPFVPQQGGAAEDDDLLRGVRGKGGGEGGGEGGVEGGGRSLRVYQREGIHWLLACWHASRSNILADEMGLGKTCQMLLTLNWLAANRRIEGPFLVVAPVSTLPHWEREVASWTGLSCVVLHGPADARRMLLQHETQHTDRAGRPTRHLRFHVLVTAYDTLSTELSTLQSISWQYLVVDEAHRLKNSDTKLVRSLRSLGAVHCTLLTGTPVQNDVNELLGLMSFLDDDAFGGGRREELLERFGSISRPEQVEELQGLIRPFVLRRTKDELSQPLPTKRETHLKVSLTASQMRVYRAIMDRSLEHIQNPRSSLRNVFMQLRKACNHPTLLEEGTAEEQEALQQAHEAAEELAQIGGGADAAGSNETGEREGGDGGGRSGRGAGTSRAAAAAGRGGGGGGALTRPDRANERRRDELLATIERGVGCLVGASGKMVLLDRLLPRLRQRGHKVLLFSQFAIMLDVLEDYLTLRAHVLGDYERVDGSVRGDARQRAIDRFQSDPACFTFLLTTRAGGQGINLTAADTVILFDSDWNPQGDAQGQARAHRIGQERPVTVYRLVTRGTYEERMLDRAIRKLSLEHAILQPASFTAAASTAAAATAAAATDADATDADAGDGVGGGENGGDGAVDVEVDGEVDGEVGGKAGGDDGGGAVSRGPTPASMLGASEATSEAGEGAGTDVSWPANGVDGSGGAGGGGVSAGGGGGGNGSGGGGMSRSELEDLLRYGAYGLLRAEDDGDGVDYGEDDIDQILDAASASALPAAADATTATAAAAAGAASSSTAGGGIVGGVLGGGGTFSRASFRPGDVTGGGGGEELLLDDPNFWSKFQAIQETRRRADEAAKEKKRPQPQKQQPSGTSMSERSKATSAQAASAAAAVAARSQGGGSKKRRSTSTSSSAASTAGPSSSSAAGMRPDESDSRPETPSFAEPKPAPKVPLAAKAPVAKAPVTKAPVAKAARAGKANAPTKPVAFGRKEAYAYARDDDDDDDDDDDHDDDFERPAAVPAHRAASLSAWSGHQASTSDGLHLQRRGKWVYAEPSREHNASCSASHMPLPSVAASSASAPSMQTPAPLALARALTEAIGQGRSSSGALKRTAEAATDPAATSTTLASLTGRAHATSKSSERGSVRAGERGGAPGGKRLRVDQASSTAALMPHAPAPPPDPSRPPILDEWSMTEAGHFRGRVYGKKGVTDGRWIVTSYVPPERRDIPASCVWTESGSTYRLGRPAADKASAK